MAQGLGSPCLERGAPEDPGYIRAMQWAEVCSRGRWHSVMCTRGTEPCSAPGHPSSLPAAGASLSPAHPPVPTVPAAQLFCRQPDPSF